MRKRYVVDTNCLLMMLSFKKAYHSLWLDFINEKFDLVISNEILEEYLEVIGRNIRQDVAEYVSNVILNSDNVIRVSPAYRFGLIKADPDDNKFVDCAICGNAELIVTNDKHYNELDKVDFPKVLHINIDTWMHISGYNNY